MAFLLLLSIELAQTHNNTQESPKLPNFVEINNIKTN